MTSFSKRFLLCCLLIFGGLGLGLGKQANTNFKNLRLLWSSEANVGQVETVILSTDSKTFVTASNTDYTIRVWDTKTGKQRHIIGGNEWDTELGFQQTERDGFGYVNVKLAFHPSGKYFAASTRTKVRFWDIKTMKNFQTIDAPGGLVSEIGFNPQGTLFGFVWEKNFLKIFDLKKKRVIRTLENKDGNYKFKFTPSGKRIVTLKNAALGEGMIHLWEVQSGQKLKSIPEKSMNATTVVVDKSEKFVAVAGTRGEVAVYDTRW
jgi:WD40 repeat protein